MNINSAFSKAMKREEIRRRVMVRTAKLAASSGVPVDQIRGLVSAVNPCKKPLAVPFDWSACEVYKNHLKEAQAQMSRAAIMRFLGNEAEADISENVARGMLAGAYTFSQPDAWIDQFFSGRNSGEKSIHGINKGGDL